MPEQNDREELAKKFYTMHRSHIALSSFKSLSDIDTWEQLYPFDKSVWFEIYDIFLAREQRIRDEAYIQGAKDERMKVRAEEKK